HPHADRRASSSGSTRVHAFALLYFYASCCTVGPAVGRNEKSASKRQSENAGRPALGRRVTHVLLLFVASLIVVDGLFGERGLLAILRARQQYDELSATITRQRNENVRL